MSNKETLIAKIAQKHDLSKKQAGEIVTSVFDEVAGFIVDGGFSVVGFGAFSVKAREARTGRNPSTGAEIQIPAKNAIVFKAGKNLKDSVN